MSKSKNEQNNASAPENKDVSVQNTSPEPEKNDAVPKNETPEPAKKEAKPKKKSSAPDKKDAKPKKKSAASTKNDSKPDNNTQNKNEKPCKCRLNKKNALFTILLSISFSFTFLFFPAIDIFLGNQREFIVEFNRVAIPMLAFALGIAVGMIVLLNLFLLISEWLYRIVSRLLFGLLLAGYLQALFFNGKMSSLTGDNTNTADSATVTINLIIFGLITVIPLIFSVCAYYNPKSKLLNAGSGMILPYICGLVFVMQLVGTSTSMIESDFSKYQKQYTKYLSYESSMSLSKNGNIIVFLVDRLDGNWMDDVIRDFPDVNDKFDGFTFYQNNISHTTSTFPSVPQMLTNNLYGGQEWADYISKSWDGYTVPYTLTQNNYKVNLLIDNLTTYGSISQIEDQCDNINECSESDMRFDYYGRYGIISTMTRLSLSRLSPYVLKGEFTRGMGSDLSSHFVEYTSDIEDYAPLTVGIASDLKYFDYLKAHGLTSDSPRKTFTFLHLNGCHDPIRTITDLYDDSIEPTFASTARGDFEILFYYFDQLKKLGIYDNSTIIVLGDHGRAPDETEKEGKDGIESPIMTGLLIKPAGAESGKLKIDSTSELSNDFFGASILDYAGIDHSDLGYSYQDIIDGQLHVDRYMQTYAWGGFGKVYYKTLYKVTGNARDFSNWEPQPEHE